MAETKKSVLIVDDHPLFREGLKALLARHPSFEVVGEAGTNDAGLKKAKRLAPDLVLVDISLPDKSGIDLTRAIRELLPNTRVAIVSMHSRVDYIVDAFRAGATGYVVKESASQRLVECLDAVVKGHYFLDASLSHKVVEHIMKDDGTGARIRDSGYGNLSSREQQVMRLLAEGYSAKEIAAQLFISAKTVENHRANILRKLGLHSTLELVRYAARIGLIDVGLWKE